MSKRGSGGLTFLEFFLGGMTLMFVYLKLTGEIDWSWLWVFSPLWLPVVVALSVAAVLGVLYLIFALIMWWWNK